MQLVTQTTNKLTRAEPHPFIHICDRICEKGSYTRIQFFDFMDV